MTVVDEAKQDVQEIHDLIARDKKAAAAKWVREFHRQARSLSRLPHRYDPVSEAEDVHRPWRQIIYGNYRIIYRIDENRVTVLRVIHAARLLSRGFFERLAKQSSKE